MKELEVKSIKQLIDIALSNGNKYAEFSFSRLPIQQSKIIEKQIGLKLVGVDRTMDTEAIRHTLRRHGSQVDEAKRGQVAVSLDDFAKVPLILKEPDEIRYAGKNALKQDVFIYTKSISDIYFVAEAVKVASDGNKLVFKTMYKRKKKTATK